MPFHSTPPAKLQQIFGRIFGRIFHYNNNTTNALHIVSVGLCRLPYFFATHMPNNPNLPVTRTTFFVQVFHRQFRADAPDIFLKKRLLSSEYQQHVLTQKYWHSHKSTLARLPCQQLVRGPRQLPRHASLTTKTYTSDYRGDFFTSAKIGDNIAGPIAASSPKRMETETNALLSQKKQTIGTILPKYAHINLITSILQHKILPKILLKFLPKPGNFHALR